MSENIIQRRRAFWGAWFPITTEKNAELMAWLFSEGYAANADRMTFSECRALTGTFNGFASNTSFTYAEEFAYFVNKTNSYLGDGLITRNTKLRALCMPKSFSSFGSNGGVLWGCTKKAVDLVLPYDGVVGTTSSADNLTPFIKTLWVADSYVDDYKAHTRWSLCDVQPISEYQWINQEVGDFILGGGVIG